MVRKQISFLITQYDPYFKEKEKKTINKQINKIVAIFNQDFNAFYYCDVKRLVTFSKAGLNC